MDLEFLGSILVVWLGIITLFNGALIYSMSKKQDEDGAVLAFGTSLFVFFGTAIATIWIFRAIS
jgi:hypothetical protein